MRPERREGTASSTYFDQPHSAIATVHDEGLVRVWLCFCILSAVNGVELLLVFLFNNRFLHCLKGGCSNSRSRKVSKSSSDGLLAVLQGDACYEGYEGDDAAQKSSL